MPYLANVGTLIPVDPGVRVPWQRRPTWLPRGGWVPVMRGLGGAAGQIINATTGEGPAAHFTVGDKLHLVVTGGGINQPVKWTVTGKGRDIYSALGLTAGVNAVPTPLQI